MQNYEFFCIYQNYFVLLQPLLKKMHKFYLNRTASNAIVRLKRSNRGDLFVYDKTSSQELKNFLGRTANEVIVRPKSGGTEDFNVALRQSASEVAEREGAIWF